MKKNKLDSPLDAKRYRVTYREESLYVVISVDNENNPLEIFVEFPKGHNIGRIYMEAGWDACTRMASLALQCKNISLSKIIRQLEKSSRSKNDLPGIIANLLKEYLKGE